MNNRREAVLHRYLTRWENETSSSWPTIATVVRETYHALVPAGERVVSFSDHADAATRMRLDAQILRRLFDKAEGCPMDIEESVVMALPDRYRQDCIEELNARIGQRCSPMREEQTAAFEGMADTATEFGQLVQALAPALADSQFTPADLPYAPAIKNKANRVISILNGLIAEVDAKVINHNVVGLTR